MASANIYDINYGEYVPISKKGNVLSEIAGGSGILQEFRSEFFKNSDQNFGQKSRWLQLISMTLIKVLDLKMSQFQKSKCRLIAIKRGVKKMHSS